jgi:diguanylate cyclase (GGDEF)-like protein
VQGWQVVGAAITDLGLGIPVLNIRISTERKVDERTQALAAANERLEHGHLKGDTCLQKLADALRRSVRASDVVVRYGGEEFALVLANADLEVAHRIAEHVRAEVARLGEEHAMSPSGFVSISVGVASAHPGGHIQRDDLLRLADEGLYAAKHGGRDQVAVAPTIQPEYTTGG